MIHSMHGNGDDGSEMRMMDSQMEEMASEIEPVDVEFDTETFDELSADKVGDRVVAVVIGRVTDVDGDTISVTFDRANVMHGKLPPLGSGARFKKLERELGGKPALAAWIGRKKWGKARFQKLAAHGRKG